MKSAILLSRKHVISRIKLAFLRKDWTTTVVKAIAMKTAIVTISSTLIPRKVESIQFAEGILRAKKLKELCLLEQLIPDTTNVQVK